MCKFSERYDRPQAQTAWKAFEMSGKVADYLSYLQSTQGQVPLTGAPEQPPEDGRNADQNEGLGPQTAEYR